MMRFALQVPMRAAGPSMSVSNQPQCVTDAQEKMFMREAAWMPQQVAPTYLDGSLGGDNGFDPLCLVPLGRRGVDINGMLSKAEREAKASEMSAEDLAANVQWMREAEVKHARLAMCVRAGSNHTQG